MPRKTEVPEWILKLQERTWEIEILVSGGAIFSLFQASDFILSLFNYIRMTMALPGQGTVLYIVLIGVNLLTFGFGFQLLLRAFWISMVFINYVYPQGVNSKKITWKKPFTVDLDDGSDLYEPIMRTDRLSSTVMYLSIISSFVLAGLIILMCVFFFVIQLFPANLRGFLSEIYAFFFIAYLLDFLSFGFIRKIKGISYFFYPFFLAFDFLSLRTIYRPSLMVFSTNVKKRYAVLIITVFVGFSILSTLFSVQKTFHLPNFFDRRAYRNQLADNVGLGNFYEDEKTSIEPRISIPSKIIQGSFMEVKVTFWADDDQYMELIDKPAGKRFFSDILQVSIDDSVYRNLRWFPFKKESVIGVKTMVPVGDLPIGEHLLVVQNTPEIVAKELRSGLMVHVAKIPFWKDYNNN